MNISIGALVELAKAYQAMGWAVQAQLDQAIEEGGVPDGLNPNAIEMARQWLALCDDHGVYTGEVLPEEEEVASA